jgi:hypothetical protein
MIVKTPLLVKLKSSTVSPAMFFAFIVKVVSIPSFETLTSIGRVITPESSS